MALAQKTIDAITALAAKSDLARVIWRDRGKAPIGYVKGMAVTYGMVYAKLKAGDSAAKAMVRVVDGSGDVFDHYEEQLRAAGMITADAADATRLRYLFVILTGLGMRESSGRYCEGRDRSASNTTAETAEAGLFQQSWDSRRASPEIPRLLDQYSGASGFMGIFQEGVSVRSGDLDNYGSGDGEEFQETCKQYPAFAVECAAIGLRTLYTHWGPIIRREVEIRHEAADLFKSVQSIVDTLEPKPAGRSWFAMLVDALIGLFRPATKPAPTPHPVDATPWMPIAVKEIGFHERGENLGIEKYVEGGKTGGTTGEPWCADFANYCLEVAGIHGSRSAMARSFETHPEFVELEGPAYGAITTMWRGSKDSGSGHVFFYLGENDQGIIGLGGNQKDSVCVQYNSRQRIVGYWWPKSVPLPKIGAIHIDKIDATEGSET